MVFWHYLKSVKRPYYICSWYRPAARRLDLFRFDDLFRDMQPDVSCIPEFSMFLINALCIPLIPSISYCYSNGPFEISYFCMLAATVMEKGNVIKMKRQRHAGKLGGLPHIRFIAVTTESPLLVSVISSDSYLLKTSRRLVSVPRPYLINHAFSAAQSQAGLHFASTRRDNHDPKQTF